MYPQLVWLLHYNSCYKYNLFKFIWYQCLVFWSWSSMVLAVHWTMNMYIFFNGSFEKQCGLSVIPITDTNLSELILIPEGCHFPLKWVWKCHPCLSVDRWFSFTSNAGYSKFVYCAIMGVSLDVKRRTENWSLKLTEATCVFLVWYL